MGIRYDKDARRAINGPLIFFSDPSSLEAFSREIRGAINSGLSFYSYRSPDSHMISFGSSEGYIEGIGEPGFVIGPFDPDRPVITIPYRSMGRNTSPSLSLYSMPDRSSTLDEYSKEIKGIVSDLKNHPNGKVVAARVVLRQEPLDISEIFFDFCRRFHDAFVFCFSTPATGCWIGASPELLLEGKEGYLSSMALAGTRLAGENMAWDKKNKEEQAIVTRYICEIFRQNGLFPLIRNTYTKQTGDIEHICTPIQAEIDELTDSRLASLLKSLSPTPALCGYPKQFALEEIKRYESFDRGCYGGYCGPFHSLKEFTFNVTVRCAALNEKQHCIYAGGGITILSNIEEEWKETEIKIKNTFHLSDF